MYYDKRNSLYVGNIILDVNSPYQRIILHKGLDGLSLFLNDEVQFVENEERIYHNTLVNNVFYRNPYISKVLIMGGGDGLAARNVFEMNPRSKVYLCELDPLMIDIFSNHPDGVRINRGSISKCVNCLGDVRRTIHNFADDSIDLVIGDFPDFDLGTVELYSNGLYGQVNRVLRKGGFISLYCGGADMKNQLSGLFKDFVLYEVNLPKMGCGNIISGRVVK